MLQYQTATFHVGHNLIEEDTRNQAAGSQLFHHRAARIGASVSKVASHTDPAQPSKSHQNDYPNISKFSTAAIEYGCKDESLTLKAYESIMKQKQKISKLKNAVRLLVLSTPGSMQHLIFFVCANAAVKVVGRLNVLTASRMLTSSAT